MVRILIVIALLASRIASAQPRNAVAQPLPDERLPTGEVSVRVVAGEPAAPAPGITVTLAIAGGKTLTAPTDASGRARFSTLIGGARVTVSVPSTAPDLARSTFVVPTTGGVRLVLSTAPWKPPGTLTQPSPRSFSGKVRPDPDVAAGTCLVRLSYDDLADLQPPANIAVTLVGYASDGKVSIDTNRSDAKGIATFTGLDTSDLTAYLAVATLSRGTKIDRLISDSFVVGKSAGWRIVLSSHKRTAADAAIDQGTAAPIPKNTVRVELGGVHDPVAAVEVVDAATGKVLGKQIPKAPDKHVVFDVAATAGQVIYAQTTARGESYRSQPIVQITDRGAMLVVVPMPRFLQRFDLIGIPEGDKLAFQAKFLIDNNAWMPAQGGIEIPLPAGFTDGVLADESAAIAKLTKTGILITAPLPPGGVSVLAGFALPFKNGKATLTMDVPAGVLNARIRIEAEPGVTLELPAGIGPSTTSGGYLTVDKIMIPPKQSLQFSVVAPKLDPKAAALVKACKSLESNRRSPLIGKPLVDFTAQLLDGKQFKLSSLKGRLLVVTFNASFNRLRKDQATLGKLAVPGVEIVHVLSDQEPAAIKRAFGDIKMRVALDPPRNDSALGPITDSWNIVAVPETYVIDRTGTIRLHFINERDWSTRNAAACLQAIR